MKHINLSGYPGAGKTTMFNLFLDLYSGVTVIPKVTTRLPRPGENNLEYIFLSNEDFEGKTILGQIVGIEKIVQKDGFYYYGIPTCRLPENSPVQK